MLDSNSLEKVVIISDSDDIVVKISVDVLSIIEVISWDWFEWGVAVSFSGVVMFSVDVAMVVVVVLSVTKFLILQKLISIISKL